MIMEKELWIMVEGASWTVLGFGATFAALEVAWSERKHRALQRQQLGRRAAEVAIPQEEAGR
jgi:hypothetical protein